MVPWLVFLSCSGGPTTGNQLIHEGSAYLRQHAQDPVDWLPWSDTLFDVARAQDRPILVSIGYATCHWCHVMGHESFSDPEIAALINQRFIAVKVDREERPDVDDVYQQVVRTMTGRSGGWPTTVILAPDGTPVFAGTYLPARDGDRGASRGLLTVLTRIADGWDTDRPALLAEAAQNSAAVRDAATPRPPGTVPGREVVTAATDTLRAVYDPEYGGFGSAPKFPRVVQLELVLAESARTGDPGLRDRVVHTLAAMDAGAIHDHLGGGFHRYTVDRAWRVPHFEKMTGDNAQLVRLWLAAYQATGDPHDLDVVRSTLAGLDALALPDGGYGTARDADSTGPDGHPTEGAYYTWTPDELREVLGDDAASVAARYGVGVGDGIDGRWALAEVGGEPVPEALLARLRAARAHRPEPLLDDKRVSAVTALVVSAWARAAFVLDDPACTRAALDTAAILDTLRRPDGRLRRSSTTDEPGVLDDQVFAAEAWLDLFELTADRRWLDQATAILGEVDERYADPLGGWFRTADDAPSLLFRPRPTEDGAEPSGASIAVQLLLRLSALTSDPRWLERADRALGSYRSLLEAKPTSMPAMLEAVARRRSPPPEIVVAWPEGADPGPLLDVLRNTFVPGRVLVQGSNPTLARLSLPLVADKVPVDVPTAWVCEGGVCQRPATDPHALRDALRAVADEARSAAGSPPAAP